MKKLIAIAALALVSAHVAAEGALTQEQACNLGYVSTQCEAVDVKQTAAAPAQIAKPIVVAAVYQVTIPYINGGHFGDAAE